MRIGESELTEFFAFGRRMWRKYDAEGKKFFIMVGIGRKVPTLSDLGITIPQSLSMGWSGHFQGPPELREKVIECLKYDVGVDNVLITAGTYQANSLTLLRLVEKGSEVIVPLPTWMQIHTVCRALGAKIKVIKRREENKWKIDIDQLNELVTPDTKLIFINVPNNPTGAVCEPNEMRAICEIAKDCGAYVLCDEEQRGLEWDKPLSPAAANYYEKGVSTMSVSKTLGMDGARIGWMVSQDKEFIKDCLALSIENTQCTSILSEYVVNKVMEPNTYNKLVEEGKREARKKLKALGEWISKSDVFNFTPPEGGYVTFPRYDMNMGSEELCRTLINEPYRTYLVPGFAYGFEKHVRIGIGERVDLNTFKEGLRNIDKFVEDSKAKESK